MNDVPDQPDDPRSIVLNSALEAGVDPVLWGAQVHRESAFNPNAVSPVGAMGLAQVMPKTFADVAARRFPGQNLDINNPHDNARVGATYMREQLDHYDGDTEKALAAYNHGPGNVDRLVSHLGDNWKSGLPKETSDYIPAITKYLPGGPQQGQPAPPPQVEQAGQPSIATNLAGDLFNVQPGGESEAAQKGLSILSPEDARQKIAEAQYGGGGQQAIGAAEQLLSGATGGFSHVAEKVLGVNPEDIQGREAAYPVQSQVLGGLGFGATLGVGGEALDALGLGLKGANAARLGLTAADAAGPAWTGLGIGSKIAGEALGWGMAGAAQQASDNILNDHQAVGEGVGEAFGLNGLIGLGSGLGMFGLGKAIETAGLKSGLGRLTGSLGEAYKSGAAFFSGVPRSDVEAVFQRAPEIVASGLQPQEFAEKEFRDHVNNVASAIEDVGNEGNDLGKAGRVAVEDHVQSQLGAEPLKISVPTWMKAEESAEKAPQNFADLYNETVNGKPTPKAAPSSVYVPGFSNSAVGQAAVDLLRDGRVALGELAANSPGGALSGNSYRAVADAYADAIKAGADLPPLDPKRGSNSLSKAMAQHLDILERDLGLSKTQADAWKAVNDFRGNMQDIVDWDKRAAHTVEPGAEASQSLAVKLAGRAADFTKDENLFPSIGPEFRAFQQAESIRLGRTQDLQRLVASIEGGGAKVVGKQKLAAVLKQAFIDQDSYVKRALDEYTGAHANQALTLDRMTGNGGRGMANSLTALEDAREQSMKAMGMNKTMARLGVHGSGPGTATLGGIGVKGFIASRVLGIPYGAAAAPFLLHQAMTQPAAVAMTKANLVAMLGKLGARINTGAIKAVGSLLAGAAGAATRGEAAEEARRYIQRDLLTGREHESVEDGVLAHRNTVVAPPDVTGVLQRSVGRLDGDHQTGVALNTAQKLSRLQQIAPRSNSIGTADEIPPSRQDMLRYSERAWAIEHPVEALNAQGMHPDPEILADIQATSPNIMARYMQAYDNELHKQWPKEDTVPLAVHRAVAIMHGGDLGPPGLFGAHMQAAYALASAPPPGQQGGQQGQPRKPRKGDAKWSENLTLPSHSSMI